jgi:hypothetical protein
MASFDLGISGDAIVAVGWSAGGLGGSRFRLARLDASGARDPSFGEDGQIVTGGRVVLRLTPDGELDPSFGKGGVVVAGEPQADERAVAVAISPGGRILVAGDAFGVVARNGCERARCEKPCCWRAVSPARRRPGAAARALERRYACASARSSCTIATRPGGEDVKRMRTRSSARVSSSVTFAYSSPPI